MRTLFRPASIAVVGATPNAGTGHNTLANCASVGYEGKVVAINPRYQEVLGVPCYPSLTEAPFVPEAVVFAVNRALLADVVDEAAGLGVRAGVAFAIGMGEADGAGREWEARAVAAARAAGLALIGPNCQGLINFREPCAMYGPPVQHYEAGSVALFSESGSVTSTLVNNTRGVRWSHAVSCGNEAVVDSADLLGYFVDDPGVSVVCAFLETIRDPDRFFAEADRALGLGKPVVVLKSGRSPQARAAAVRHTGAPEVSDHTIDTLMRRHGVIRVDSTADLLETAIALQSPGRPRGRRIAIVSGSGGGIELALDAADELGLPSPDFSDEVTATLRGLLPEFGIAINPLDFWGAPNLDQNYATICQTVAGDPNIDMLVCLTQSGNYPTGGGQNFDWLTDGPASAAAAGQAVVAAIDITSGAPDGEAVEQRLAQGVVLLSGITDGLRALSRLADFAAAERDRAPGGSTQCAPST